MDSDTSLDAMASPSCSDDPWKLRLFFSVDLIGSTAYKNYFKGLENDAEWCWTFEEFYSNFPATLEREKIRIEEWAKPTREDFASAAPWKFLGDEILFQVELSDYRETLSHLRALQLALQEYNEKLRDKLEFKKNVILQCKATAWLAGFPISNVAIKIPPYCQTNRSMTDSSLSANFLDEHEDFIGSQMDCGFRLTRYASARKLVLSVDLAVMFATAMLDACGNHGTVVTDKMRVRFDGKESLKGVLTGKPYPIFWLDQEPKNQDLEDKWLGLGEDCKPEEVVTYCNKFLESTEGTHRPFIDQGRGDKFTAKPIDFERRREKAISERNRLRNIGRQDGGDSVSTENPITGPLPNKLERPNDNSENPKIELQ